MGQRILFSPVGTTDPWRDDYEGPLLQIMRHYRPDIVYLFLTAEMAEKADQDDRYRRAIRRQAQNLGRNPGDQALASNSPESVHVDRSTDHGPDRGSADHEQTAGMGDIHPESRPEVRPLIGPVFNRAEFADVTDPTIDNWIHVIRSHITDPSDFNGFSEAYRDSFQTIVTAHPDAEYLINLSSGTPQMIATASLLAASQFLSQVYHCIQVRTPAKRSGVRSPYMQTYQDSDIDNLLDNLPEAENRCTEPDILFFINTMRREQLQKLLDRYDYAGAAELGQQSPGTFSPAISRWLHHMTARVGFDRAKAANMITAADLADFNPYPVVNSQIVDIYEFYLGAQVKVQRGDWSDFILRLSPLLTRLLRFYMVVRLHYPLDRISSKTRQGEKLTRSLIQKNDPGLLTYLDREFSPAGFKDGYIMLSNLRHILKYAISQPDYQRKNVQAVHDLFDRLRETEEKLRNPIAHNMVRVTDSWAVRETGYNFIRIARDLEKLLELTMENDFRPGWRDLPDRLNQYLSKLIDLS